MVENELRDFRLGGAELPEAQKVRFKEVQEELANLSAQFDDNVLDATNAWAQFVEDDAALAGIPADVVAQARAEAEAEGRSPATSSRCARPATCRCCSTPTTATLRAQMHRAYSTLASELGADPAQDNTAIIERILALRAEEAELLGYANFAEVSLVPKMAASPAEVIAFVRDLARRARPFAERDFAEVTRLRRAPSSASPIRRHGTCRTPPRSCGSSATSTPSRR